jgi:hypothetical protein
MNEKTPEYFQKKPVYVCLIAELSDGHLLHFARITCVHLLKFDEHEADFTQCQETEQRARSHVRSEVDERNSDRKGVRDVRYYRYVGLSTVSMFLD